MPRQADATLFGDVLGCAAVPMHWDGELRGVLAVGYTRPRLVTQEHLSLLEAFGELAAAACRNASAHAGLALAARTDGLTGCLNHAALHDALQREIERCERTGHRLSLVLVDLDDFKQVNEEHGHLVGDEVLRRVGRRPAPGRAPLRPGGALRRRRVRDRGGRGRRARSARGSGPRARGRATLACRHAGRAGRGRRQRGHRRVVARGAARPR